MSRSRIGRVLVASALTMCAFVALLLMLVPVLFAPVGATGKFLLAFSFPELGFAAVALFFLVVIGEDRTFIDFDRPNIRDVGLGTIGTVAFVLFNLGVHWLFARAGFETTSRFPEPLGVETPFVFVTLSLIFLFIVGPSEELFFRGVVQRYLTGGLTRRGAYAWTSLLFAGFHLPAVSGAGGSLAQYVLVGGVLYVVSWALGWLYDHTRNIVVPMLVHSFYNIFVFASLVYGVMP